MNALSEHAVEVPASDWVEAPASDWGAACEQRLPALAWLWIGLVLGAPVVLVALLAWLLAGPVGALVALVISGGAVLWWVRSQGRAALRRAGARRLEDGAHARLTNLARGLSADLGVAAPSLWLVDEGGPNALVCSAGGPALAITASLLESYTRTELEAVVAHCLVRSRPRALTRASLAVALGPAGRDLIAGATTDWDLRTVAVTRYPPALAAALRKAETVPGRGTELWFAPATAPSPEERAEALADL